MISERVKNKKDIKCLEKQNKNGTFAENVDYEEISFGNSDIL